MNSGMNVATPQSDEWETPDWLFRALDAEFGFTFDAAADEKNTKCKSFANNIGEWEIESTLFSHERVFCNPPYSNIGLFVDSALCSKAVWVLLLPARTDNDWFWRMNAGLNRSRVEIRWFRKRIKFLEGGVEMGSPRFASMLAIIR